MITTLLANIAASHWGRAALRYGAIALTIALFLLALRRSGERAGRLAERLETVEKTHDVQHQMLDAAARRPRDRDELAERLRDGEF
jgi:hypothetical protein